MYISQDDSSLQCAKYARYCRATNLYLDFTQVDFSGTEK